MKKISGVWPNGNVENKVAIAITTFRNPAKLDRLLENMKWSGLPDVPVRVFEDRSPAGDDERLHVEYYGVCRHHNVPYYTSKEWGCMQGSIDFAVGMCGEPWVIYVPDDVLFPPGALWNEVAAVLTYGRHFVGGIQFPYWNSEEHSWLMPGGNPVYGRNVMDRIYGGESFDPLLFIDRSEHWDHGNIPRKYVNLNGAGFAINRELYARMGGWPKQTWRLDEYAGFMAWKHGMVVVTVPGPPRLHYFGGSTPQMPSDKPDFSSEAAWKDATGLTPYEAGMICRAKMAQIPETPGIPDGTWNDILEFFNNGGVLV